MIASWVLREVRGQGWWTWGGHQVHGGESGTTNMNPNWRFGNGGNRNRARTNKEDVPAMPAFFLLLGNAKSFFTSHHWTCDLEHSLPDSLHGWVFCRLLGLGFFVIFLVMPSIVNVYWFCLLNCRTNYEGNSIIFSVSVSSAAVTSSP